MTPIDRRKNDQEFREKLLLFMARIDQRNLDKDLNYAVQEDLVLAHETRITCLEHKATRIEAVGVLATSGFGVWLANKMGIHF